MNKKLKKLDRYLTSSPDDFENKSQIGYNEEIIEKYEVEYINFINREEK